MNLGRWRADWWAALTPPQQGGPGHSCSQLPGDRLPSFISEMLRKWSFEVVYKTGINVPILSPSWLQDLSNNSNQQMGAPGHPSQRQHQLKHAQQNPAYTHLQDAAFNWMNFSIYDFCHAGFLSYPVMALPAELFGFAFQICLGLSRNQNTCNYHLSSSSIYYFSSCSQLRLIH